MQKTRCPDCGTLMRYRKKTDDWVCMGGCPKIITNTEAKAIEEALLATKPKEEPVKSDHIIQDAGSVRFEDMNFEKK